MFKSICKKLFSKEIILYLVFGVLTTLVDTVVFYISNYTLNIHYVISTCLAWIFAVLFAYVTNKLFVFSAIKNKQNIFKEMFYFFSLRLVSLLLSIIFMVLMVNVFSINELLSKILVNFLVVISNYFFSKIFIFKS
ncbi:GtrA family protein [uncultured Tyzzerella sp.]|uniref:GtrA family protein n=1 Tax=uncultured Tyzzerella sp. TaxID=2321398 RepID=UPI002942B336|nr:GtrA family protein [uncultured Tyzzerella sp.]